MLVHNIIVNDDGSLFLPLPLSSRPLRATETSHQYEVSEFMVNFNSKQKTNGFVFNNPKKYSNDVNKNYLYMIRT